MSEVISLAPLYILQAGLDETIHKEHNETYKTTIRKRMLALLVELGEFANETRCFKFWSLKGPSGKERILDEYADGMHFFLSLGIPLGEKEFTHEIVKKDEPLSEQLLSVYGLVVDLCRDYDLAHYEKALGAYLDILASLSYSASDAILAYKSKLAVNYKRQEQKY